MSLNTLTSTCQVSVTWNASITLTGSDYSPVSNTSRIGKSKIGGTAAAVGVLGGANQLVSYIISIAGGGNTTIDLTSLTNICQQAGITLTRIKSYCMRLLSVADDSTIGTACTSVTVGNAATNANLLELSSATPTYDVKTGGCHYHGDDTAGGITVDGTHKSLKILNNDGAVTAKVQLTIIGTDT